MPWNSDRTLDVECSPGVHGMHMLDRLEASLDRARETLKDKIVTVILYSDFMYWAMMYSSFKCKIDVVKFEI